MTQAALEVCGVSHAYGTRLALDAVSLAVPAARFGALLGLNGAGKTTLLSLVTRLFHCRQGSIRVLGHPVDGAPGAALRRLGVVFQARTLDLDLSVRENLLYHAALHGIGRARARLLADAALERWGWPGGRASRRAGFPAGRCGGWKSRGRCCTGRGCWCSTSRRWGSSPARAAILRQVRGLVAGAAWRCCGRRICWTKSSRAMSSVVLHKGRVLAAGEAAAIVADSGAAICAPPSRHGRPERRHDAPPAGRRGFGLRLPDLPRRHRPARGPALPAPARALRFGAGAPAGLAVHIRRRVPPDPRRVDHPALSHLRAVPGLRDAGADRHDPAVQRHAVLAVDGLRPRDGQHAPAAGEPLPALVPAARPAAGGHRGVGAAGLCVPGDRRAVGGRGRRWAGSACCRRCCCAA